jgi:hypothetical protein
MAVNANLIYWPLLAQVVLTIAMYILLGIRKAKAIKTGRVNRKLTALDNRAWPEEVLKVSNNIANQFESPILFYVLCLLFHSINMIGNGVLLLAWAYALSRYAHAFVHVGANYVPLRLRLFLFGQFMLLSLVLVAAWELATAILPQSLPPF